MTEQNDGRAHCGGSLLTASASVIIITLYFFKHVYVVLLRRCIRNRWLGLGMNIVRIHFDSIWHSHEMCAEFSRQRTDDCTSPTIEQTKDVHSFSFFDKSIIAKGKVFPFLLHKLNRNYLINKSLWLAHSRSFLIFYDWWCLAMDGRLIYAHHSRMDHILFGAA